MRPRPGVLVGDRYELLTPIATGGMGAVWEATDTTLHRPVAIKLLKPELSSDPTFLARFRAEARHSGSLSHPNIAAVYDYGETADVETGVVSAYLVMELVPGEPLSTVLHNHDSLSPERVLSIMRQVGSGLAAAHAAGIVHRDIKPGNLLLTPDGRIKITDFGIARAADSVPLTATGTVMGTARYLSPEQATGEAVVPASDIYSVGVVAYEALAGRSPFTAKGQVALAMAHVHDEPRPLPDTVPGPVRALIGRLLAKHPDERPPNGASLVQAVDAAARGDDIGATTVISPVRDIEATQQMPATDETAVVGPALPGPKGRLGAAVGSGAAGAGMAGAGMARAELRGAPRAPTGSQAPMVTPSSGRPRRRLTGPLIALILLVLFVALGAVFADMLSGREQPTIPSTVTVTQSTQEQTTTVTTTLPAPTETSSTTTRTSPATTRPETTEPETDIPDTDGASDSSIDTGQGQRGRATDQAAQAREGSD